MNFFKFFSRFLYHCNNKEVDMKALSHQQLVNNYITQVKIKTTTAASTMKNILSCICDGSRFLDVHAKEIRLCSHREMKEYIAGLKTSLNDIHTRRKHYNRVHILELHAAKPDLNTTASKVRRYAPKIKQLMAKSLGLLCKEINTVTSYLVTRLAIENASRPSHVINLTIGEYEAGTRFGGDWLCICTYSKNGIAPVTFSKEMKALTDTYVRTVRTQIAATNGRQHIYKLFVNNKANAITNFSSDRHLYGILNLCGVNRKFNLTMLRKSVTTQAVRRFAGDRKTLVSVNSYLAHSNDVAEYYYTAVNTRKDFHKGYNVIKKMLK